MASTTTSESTGDVQRPRGQNQFQRGRGGGSQGRYNGNTFNESAGSERGRGRGGRRGGYRGRGGRGGADGNRQMPVGESDGSIPNPAVPPLPNPNIRGYSSVRLTGDAKVQEGEAASKGKEAVLEDGDDGEVCFICASPVAHNAVSPCNHRTCHICALRLRALYKTKACAHCRTVSDFVIFTDDPVKRYEDYTDGDFASIDANLGIKYEKAEIFEDTVLLLRYNCPEPSCDVACLGWPDLHGHVKSVHHKVMCDLCTRNKKSFTHEHELFTFSELRKHEKFGDDHPGAEDQTGFRGHPECGFCRQRFYGDDELYAHCRDRHERCHICDKRNNGKAQYFVDYNSLEAHFRKDHYLCPDQECLDKKFVVFESQVDLQAHQLQEHPNGLSKDARRDARRIDMSNFDYRTGYQHERGGRREGRGRGRGRDPNTEPLPASSAQPMRRDEIAYQRQLAIQSAQSIAPRTFGGQLSSTEAYAARPTTATNPTTVAASRPAQEPTVSLSPLNINEIVTAPRTASPIQGTETPQEQARRLRHNAVTERAATLLGNDQRKINEFRIKVSAYKNGTTSASDLIDTFFALFDTSSAQLGKLIKELAEIFEVTGKRDGLLKAWNDWKAINEDYPSLPAPSGSPAGTSTSSIARAAGARVLKLKSSTAQSSRAAPGWGSAGPKNTSSNPFPPLATANRAGAGKVGPIPWTGGSSTSSSRQPPAATVRSTQSRTTAPPSADAFPALPTAAKPTMPILGYGYGTSVIRNQKVATANAWSKSSGNEVSSGSSAAVAAEPEMDESGLGVSAAGGKKKGRSGKKQTLFHFG